MDNFRDSYFQVDWDLTTKRLKGTYWGKQYDTGRGFAVTVINGGQVVAPTTEVLRLKWEKPDNTTGYVNATIVNGKFIVENIDQMFTVHGIVRADFELSVGGEFVASITFYVNVEKAVAVDAIESSSDFTALQVAIATVDSIDAQLAQKATKKELDSLGQLKLNGTYATLTDLQNAYPTGSDGLYLVTADGYVYRWDGVNWIQAIQFQSTGIAKGSITPDKTSFLEKNISKNRFDKSSVVLDHMYSSGNFVAVDPSFKYGSLLIEDIEGISNLTFSSPDITLDSAKLYNVCFFDVNGNFINELVLQQFIKKSNPITIAIPANAYSVGVSIASYGYASDKKYMAEEGTEVTAYEDYIPPYYYLKEVKTDKESDIKIKLPTSIPAIVGEEINIYFENVILVENLANYNIDVNCSIGKQQNERWTCIPTSAGTHTLTINIYKNNEFVASVSTDIIIKEKSVGNGITKKAIFIGDSTTAAGTYTGELVNNLFANDVMNLELLGTRGTSPNLHEGRGGWRASNYVNDSSVGGLVNAFYNNGFDFTYYMNQQGYTSVDFVGINLGINDMFSFTSDDSALTEIANILYRFDIMLNSIHAFDPNIKVGFLITTPPSKNQDSFGNNYGNGQTQWRYRRNNFLFVEKLIDKYRDRESENIYLVPINVNLDTENNMMTETVQVNSRNTKTVVRQSNGVHPATSGYFQISDVIYYWLKSFEI